MAKELHRLRILIAGLTEARIPHSGEQSVDGYTLLHSGEATRVHGVALMLDRTTSSALMSWQPISGRLLKARLKHRQGALTIIVAYAPTEEHHAVEKDNFYAQLEALSRSISPHDQLLILGDLNAVSGTDRQGYEQVVGKFGHGNANDNTFRLLSFCSSLSLSLMGSWLSAKRYTGCHGSPTTVSQRKSLTTSSHPTGLCFGPTA